MMSKDPDYPAPAKRKRTPTCPYPGLRSFFVKETDWYFGRESHVHEALTRLEDHRFLAIVGASGSGKSSLAFAGIIPALEAGDLAGSARRNSDGTPAPWSILHFRPGKDPLRALNGVLVRQSPFAKDPLLPGYVDSALRSGDNGLLEAIRSAGHSGEDREILVYIDQFEELIHYGDQTSLASREDAQRFGRLLVVAAAQREVRLHLLLSIRSDFIGDCDRFPGLPELVSGSQFLTPRLTRRQMERSFGLPAEVQGWKVESEALNALLNDCGDSPDQLPLAQHVFSRMWRNAEARGKTTLDHEDYMAVGGFRGSLSQHGEEIIQKLKGGAAPASTDLARRFFMALCDQGEDGRLVRRASKREEIAAIVGCSLVDLELVIEAFGGDDPGFIREDEDGLLDVRHESILRQWHRISEWRKAETEAEGWLRQLSDVATELKGDESDTSTFWKGTKLQRFLKWRQEFAPTSAWAARHGVTNWATCEDFIRTSLAEEKAAESARRTRRIILWFVSILIGASALVLWRFFEESATKAKIEKERADASETALAMAKEEKARAEDAVVNLQIEKDFQIAQLAIQGKQEKEELERRLKETEQKLLELELDSADQTEVKRVFGEALTSIAENPLVSRLTGAKKGIAVAGYSPDGRFVATGSGDGKIRLWSRLGGPAISERDEKSAVTALAFSPDSAGLLAGFGDGTLRIYDPRRLAETKEEMVGEMSAHKGVITHVEFSPSGAYSLSTGADATVALLDWRAYPKVAPTGLPRKFAHGRSVTLGVFDSTGNRIVTSSDDGQLRIFATPDLSLPGIWVGSENINPLKLDRGPTDSPTPVRGARFSPRDPNLVVSGAGNSKVVWYFLDGNQSAKYQDNLHNEQQRGPFAHLGAVHDLAFRPSGTHLATIASDGLCLIWDVTSAKTIASVSTRIRGRLFDVEWHQNDLLALVGEDGWLELWDLAQPGQPKPLFATQAHEGVARGVRFDPLGEQVLTWSGVTGDATLLTPKGKAAEFEISDPTLRSDNTAAIWGIEAARNIGWPKN